MTSPDSRFRHQGHISCCRRDHKMGSKNNSPTPSSSEYKIPSSIASPASLTWAPFLQFRGRSRVASLGQLLFIICIGILLLTPSELWAQQLDCLSCHGTSGMQDSSGKSISIAADTFHSSVHGSLGCNACHTDIKAFPHPAHLAPVNCAACHSQEAAGIAGSVHSNASAHPCLSCHGNPHSIVPVTDPKSPVYPLNIPRTCGSCHGNAAFVKQHHLKNVYGEYVDSIHGAALRNEGLLVAANCSSCHGTHHILSHKNPQSSIYRTNIPATCGKCHAGIEAKYLAGAHGKALVAGSQKAPICTDCHTAHRIAQPQQTAFQEKTVGTCGNCHKEKYATYRDTFHAQVSALGYTEVAHCWDCHGPHEVLPASDPLSPVNRANLVKTCSKCHKDANAQFVSYEPHANAYDFHTNPALYSIRLFMDLLLWSVLGFFTIHTILWFMRLQVDHWRGRNSEGNEDE